jgi:IS5 family transposase
MGRNYLRGIKGDRINALLAAVGFNFHLLVRWFAGFLCLLIRWLIAQADKEKPA